MLASDALKPRPVGSVDNMLFVLLQVPPTATYGGRRGSLCYYKATYQKRVFLIVPSNVCTSVYNGAVVRYSHTNLGIQLQFSVLGCNSPYSEISSLLKTCNYFEKQ